VHLRIHDVEIHSPILWGRGSATEDT
jgi:hypothetical protein